MLKLQIALWIRLYNKSMAKNIKIILWYKPCNKYTKNIVMKIEYSKDKKQQVYVKKYYLEIVLWCVKVPNDQQASDRHSEGHIVGNVSAQTGWIFSNAAVSNAKTSACKHRCVRCNWQNCVMVICIIIIMSFLLFLEF